MAKRCAHRAILSARDSALNRVGSEIRDNALSRRRLIKDAVVIDVIKNSEKISKKRNAERRRGAPV